MYVNKMHLKATKDLNGWYMFIKWKYRLQLCWDSSRWGFWLKQFADRLGKKDFMKDFTEILQLMAEEGASPFTLYELQEKWKKTSDTHFPPKARWSNQM